MIAFQLDFFDKNPLEVHRNEDGHIQFKNTGDDLIDKWEEQIARGETPNFAEDAFDEEALAKIERLRKRGQARTGGSFKNVVDSVEQSAIKQGLSTGLSGVPERYRYQRSSFGDGEDH